MGAFWQQCVQHALCLLHCNCNARQSFHVPDAETKHIQSASSLGTMCAQQNDVCVCVCRGAASQIQRMCIRRAVGGSDVSLRRYVMCVISKPFMGSSCCEKRHAAMKQCLSLLHLCSTCFIRPLCLRLICQKSGHDGQTMPQGMLRAC